MTDNTNSESNSTDTSLQDKILKHCETLGEAVLAFLITYTKRKIAAGDLCHTLANVYERMTTEYHRRGFDPLALSAAANIEIDQESLTYMSSISAEELGAAYFGLCDDIDNGDDDDDNIFAITAIKSELILRGYFNLMRVTVRQSDKGITLL
jgi:hypothetical protein